MTQLTPFQTQLTKYDTPHGMVELSIPIIKEYLCPRATPQEAMLFLKLCAHQGLNPFLREAYLIKYGDKPATMVVGKDTFTQRAEAHPQFDGFRAGITVLTDHEIDEVEGSLKGPSDTLIGGWAEIYRRDRRVPTKITVSMEEYDTHQSSWLKMPATMIRKVALVQALREAFPSSFVGLYDSSEMGAELPTDTPLPKMAAPHPASPVVIEDAAEPTEEEKEQRDRMLREANLGEDHYCAEHQKLYRLTTSTRTGQSRWIHKLDDGSYCMEGA